jgi:hypothetical protein
VLGVCDPGADTALDPVQTDDPGAVAVAQATQPVSKSAHVVVGQAAAAAG